MARLSRRVWASMRRTPGQFPKIWPDSQRTAAVPIPVPRWASAMRRSQLGSQELPRSSTRSRPTALAVPLQPPGAGAVAVQVPAGDHPGRLGGGEAGLGVERPLVRAQEPGQLVPVGAGRGPVGRIGHGRMVARCATIAGMSTTAPTRERTERQDDVAEPDIPWVVIVWNDPVNLMSYVVFVLQKLFGYDREKATRLMLDVHHKGKAVVSSGPREKAEFDVYRLHGHGLWATMQKDR
jgi:ATP-dependent Clp protease adaptor protein ClpS